MSHVYKSPGMAKLRKRSWDLYYFNKSWVVVCRHSGHRSNWQFIVSLGLSVCRHWRVRINRKCYGDVWNCQIQKIKNKRMQNVVQLKPNWWNEWPRVGFFFFCQDSKDLRKQIIKCLLHSKCVRSGYIFTNNKQLLKELDSLLSIMKSTSQFWKVKETFLIAISVSTLQEVETVRKTINILDITVYSNSKSPAT